MNFLKRKAEAEQEPRSGVASMTVNLKMPVPALINAGVGGMAHIYERGGHSSVRHFKKEEGTSSQARAYTPAAAPPASESRKPVPRSLDAGA